MVYIYIYISNAQYVVTVFQHKCEQYWPDKGSKQYGDIEVTAEDFEQLADYTVRTFSMARVGVQGLYIYTDTWLRFNQFKLAIIHSCIYT